MGDTLTSIKGFTIKVFTNEADEYVYAESIDNDELDKYLAKNVTKTNNPKKLINMLESAVEEYRKENK